MNIQIWKEDTENQLGAMCISACKYLLNEELPTLWVNDTFYTMCGYNEEEYRILFHDSATLLFQQTPKDFEKLKEIVEYAYRNKSQQCECFCRLPVKGGSRLWIHMTGTFAGERIDGIPVAYVVYTNVEDMMRIRQNLEQEYERLNLVLQAEMKTVSCTRLMYISNDMQSYMDQLLKEIGEFMYIERAYALELQNGYMNNIYEWCSDGVGSSMEFRQNMDVELLVIWEDFIEQRKNVSISNVERIQKSSPQTYGVLHVQNIHSITLSPIAQNNKSIGFIGVDNPAPDHMRNFSMLETISYFMNVAMGKKDLSDRLPHNSYYDDPTGVYNRNRYLQDLNQLNGRQIPLGIVYMDIDGLKDINDHLGHIYGDKVLTEGAFILKKAFNTGAIY